MRKLSFIAIMVLLVIASCTKKSVPTSANNKPTVPGETASAGAPVFQQYCERCHGENGSGGRAPDLTRDDFKKNEVVDKVANGTGRMPAFASSLSAKEIDAVAEFVVHLKK